MAQVSVGLNVTSRWRPRLEDRLQAGGAGTPRKGLRLLSSGPGPGLQGPVLRPHLLGADTGTFQFSDSLYESRQAKGPRAQVQERRRFFGKASGLFWPRAAFSLAFFLSPVSLKPQD